MNLSPTAQATLLLTSYFSKASREDTKPLTNTEWGRFAVWLKENRLTPADLLVADPAPLLKGWHDSKITSERTLQLLGRGHSLALAVEKWHRAGLWVITRSDPEYPKRLKAHLKTDCPPVLFGCGAKQLLNAGGLAVVGSRNASDQDLAFTRQLGAQAASEQITVVSGGARGVDETAMLGAMDASGGVIGVMADSLLKAATSAKWRKGLMAGNVVLVSPFYPEAGFNAGNAMARNKYIYCLADSALVVHSGQKGGTLSGAEENLRKGWVPLWIKPTTDESAANATLVAKGGYWCGDELNSFSVASLLRTVSPSPPEAQEGQPDLLSLNERTEPDPLHVRESAPTTSGRGDTTPVDFYSLFLQELGRLAPDPVTATELAEKTGLHQTQVNAWLQQAQDDGRLIKLTRPIRYQLASGI